MRYGEVFSGKSCHYTRCGYGDYFALKNTIIIRTVCEEALIFLKNFREQEFLYWRYGHYLAFSGDFPAYKYVIQDKTVVYLVYNFA